MEGDRGTRRPEDAAGHAAGFAGVYTLADDGWIGVLTLAQHEEERLRGRFYSVRFDRSYEATAVASPAEPDRIDLTIHRFNQMLRQEYVGYVLGQRREAFAGWTTWHDRPYGFLARRGGFHHPSRYGNPGDIVDRKDFVGSYTIWHGSNVGSVEIWPGPGGLAGRYRDLDGATLDVEVGGGEKESELRLAFSLEGTPFEAKGWLFTRPKNTIAGSGTWAGRTVGFYMTKFAGGEP